jgi:hypothetical protein
MTDSEPPDRDLEARLIRAGTREVPPSGTLQRTLTGLGLGASALATVSSAGALGAAKAAAPAGLLGLAKWASIGAASGLMVTAASYGVQHATRAQTPATSSSVAVRKANDLPAPVASTFAEVTPLQSPSALAAPSAAPPRAATAAASASAEADVPLAKELAFVDRGREAFQRNDAGAALALLEHYERSFPERRLMPEVLYLRMQAQRELGETGRAATLAARLLRDYPRSPHASSARSILQESSR